MLASQLDGEWVGKYRISDEWRSAVSSPRVVGFTLRLSSRGLWKFRGSVRDDPATGMPEEGEVEGWRVGSWVRFTKRMPVFRVSFEGRTVPVAEYVRATMGVDLDPSVIPPHPLIRYRGRLAGEGRVMGGHWQMEKHRLLIPGRGAIPFPSIWGAWHATRHAGEVRTLDAGGDSVQ
jgi:hypothetical protein